MEKEFVFTSESVFEGHPDKAADQVSDAILDAHLSQDSAARVACNTLLAKDLAVVAGEITSRARVDYESVVRRKLKEIGYIDSSCGLNASSCRFVTSISQQSPDIKRGVEQNEDGPGAGDQGMMFGYATNETAEMMPVGIMLAQRLSQKHSELRHNGRYPWLKPDGKNQVTVRYRGGHPVAVEKVVLSTHHEAISQDILREAMIEEVINPVIPEELKSSHMTYLINPAGPFVTGGPAADTGLTGRKIIVDTYGGSCPHGGGAFSGKDPTKVDRSATYYARYIAKNIVAAGLSDRCTVQLAYAIGKSDPVSIMVDLHGCGKVDESRLSEAVYHVFRPTPGHIIESLKLRRPIYQQTAAFGHFGRELDDFSWEKTDRAEELKRFFGIS